VGLTVDKLRSLHKGPFERFCRALLDHEYQRRFPPKAVRLDGPSPEDTADGGRDIYAEVRHLPNEQWHFSLLPDDPCEVFFSCKSHKGTPEKKPKGWLEQVRDELDSSPRLYDATRHRPVENHKKRVDSCKHPKPDLVRRMANGARYVVLVNVGVSNAREHEREFAGRLDLWAKHLAGKEAHVDPEWIRVLDANHIVAVYNANPFSLPEELSALLGGDETEFLWSWTDWSRRFEEERRRMGFVADEGRQSLLARLNGLVTMPRERVLRIAGAPGVGKTRLVHQFFSSDENLQARVRYTVDVVSLRRWLERDGLAEMPDAILVVDEVPGDLASSLDRSFRRTAVEASARLVIIGPRSNDEGEPPAFALEGLRDEEFRQLVETELADAALAAPRRGPIRDIVVRLSEGYPLFALWLARALAERPELLDDPRGALTDGGDPWTATMAVLAGPPDDGSRDTWRMEAELRGKALLLAILAPTEDWETLQDEEIAAFAGALHEEWPQLMGGAAKCRERGLLRTVGMNRHYISPANLERLLLNHFFGGPDGFSPIPPQRVRRYLKERANRLLERAQRVHASQRCREALAEDALASLQGSSCGREPRLLLRVARELPEETLALVALHVDQSDEDVSRAVWDVLSHLRHRRISPDAFATLENASFGLALRSDRDGDPREWVATWASMFSAALHLTHQSHEARFRLLQQRLRESDPHRRAIALEGLALLISPHATGAYRKGFDDVDGPWEEPTEVEVERRLRDGWTSLIRMTIDEVEQVRTRAQTIVADALRGGIRVGLDPKLVIALSEATSEWSVEARNALGAALDDVERYEGETLAGPRRELSESVAQLLRALEPKSFAERLMAHVGRWHPIPGPITRSDREQLERAADVDLAREAIDAPQELMGCLDWLASKQAVRSQSFGRALGEADCEQRLLERLEAELDDRLDWFVASYLAGWYERDAPAFLRWAETRVGDLRLANCLVMALTAHPATDESARLLVQLLERGGVRRGSLRGIGYWDWARSVSPPLLDQLIVLLHNTEDVDLLSEAVGLAAQRIDKNHVEGLTPLDGALVDLLERTARPHLAGTGELAWTKVALSLISRGRAEVVSTVVNAAASVRTYSHQAERTLGELVDSGHVEAVWAAVASQLASNPVSAASLEVTLRTSGFLDVVSTEAILEWVGTDEERAATVARLTSPHTDSLDALTLGLLTRFGTESIVAGAIASRAFSTPTPVHSLATFHERQADLAAAWAESHGEPIARWARGIEQQHRARAAREREDEALREHG
jgi:hypothetical protein